MESRTGMDVTLHIQIIAYILFHVQSYSIHGISKTKTSGLKKRELLLSRSKPFMSSKNPVVLLPVWRFLPEEFSDRWPRCDRIRTLGTHCPLLARL